MKHLPVGAASAALATTALATTALAAPAPAPHRQTALLDPAQLAERLSSFEEGRWILRETPAAACAVEVFHFEYRTVDGRGKPTTASAALMLPRGKAAPCAGPHPLVAALHGTMPERAYDLADLSGTNTASPRAVAFAATYAAQGYAVVAPNFAGYDTSQLGYHPYFDVRQQTADVIDAIAAARRLIPVLGGTDSGKLFLTGYSQGGWLTMATQRAIEAKGGTVTAAMPSSGPYALSALSDDIFLGRPVQGSTMYFPMGITAFQRAGLKIYRRPDELYNPRYAAGIERLLPAAQPFGALVKAGKVPATALFSTPWPALPAGAPPALRALAALSGPDQAPPQLIPVHRQGIGADALLNDAARVAYLADMAARPDGAHPAWTTGKPPAASCNALRRAFQRSDLRGWTPRAPLIMCGGDGDAAVPFRLAGKLMQRYWSSPGTAAPAGRVGLINFDAPATPGEPWAALKTSLAAMHKDFAAARGEEAWTELYHQYTLPRYCYTAARQWFDTMR